MIQSSKQKGSDKCKKPLDKAKTTILPVIMPHINGCRSFIWTKYVNWTTWIIAILKEACSATPCVLVGIFIDTLLGWLEERNQCNVDCVEPPGCNFEGCGLQMICPYVCCECENEVCTSLTPVEISQLTESYPEWQPYEICMRDDEVHPWCIGCLKNLVIRPFKCCFEALMFCCGLSPQDCRHVEEWERGRAVPSNVSEYTQEVSELSSYLFAKTKFYMLHALDLRQAREMKVEPAELEAQDLEVAQESSRQSDEKLFPIDSAYAVTQYDNVRDPETNDIVQVQRDGIVRGFMKQDRSLAVQRFVEDAVAGLVKAPRLVQATSNANLDEVARLLYSGADPDSRAPVCNGLHALDTRNHWVSAKVAGSSSATALHVCSALVTPVSVTMARLLLDHRANPNELLTPNFDTPLHIAAYAKNVHMLKPLVDYGIALERENAWGHTAFTLSVVTGDISTVLRLLDLNANILHQVKCEDIRQIPLYPIQLAQRFGHFRLAEKVLKPRHEEALARVPPVVEPPPMGWRRETRDGVVFLVENQTRNFRREDMKTKMAIISPSPYEENFETK